MMALMSRRGLKLGPICSMLLAAGLLCCCWDSPCASWAAACATTKLNGLTIGRQDAVPGGLTGGHGLLPGTGVPVFRPGSRSRLPRSCILCVVTVVTEANQRLLFVSSSLLPFLLVCPLFPLLLSGLACTSYRDSRSSCRGGEEKEAFAAFSCASCPKGFNLAPVRTREVGILTSGSSYCWPSSSHMRMLLLVPALQRELSLQASFFTTSGVDRSPTPFSAHFTKACCSTQEKLQRPLFLPRTRP